MQWLILAYRFYDVSTLTWAKYQELNFGREKTQIFSKIKIIFSPQNGYRSQRTSSSAVGSNISHLGSTGAFRKQVSFSVTPITQLKGESSENYWKG